MPEYRTVPVSSLVPDPDNHRRGLTKISELADSILENGLLQNLVVRQTTGGLMLVSGHRRHAALMKLIEQGRFPDEALVLVVDGAGTFEALVENIQREDIPPWTLGQRYVELNDAGYTMEYIAQKLGTSKGQVSMRAKIARNLAPEILAKLDRLPDKKSVSLSLLTRMAGYYDPETFEPDFQAQADTLARYLDVGNRPSGQRQRKVLPEKERVYSRFRMLAEGKTRIPSKYSLPVESLLRFLRGETKTVEVL